MTMIRALAFALALASASSLSTASAFCWTARGQRSSASLGFVSPATPYPGRACRPFVRKQKLCSIEATFRKATAAAAAVPKRSKRDMMWETRFNELKKYKDEFGDCNVPTKEGRLGEWVKTQRKSYRKGNLSAERVEQLEGIDFTWNPFEETWETRFNELKKFKDEHGDCNVNSETGGSLGTWVKDRRQDFRKSTLAADRTEQLESIGFVWDPLEELWQARFDELVQYRNEHGDCNVPQKEAPLGKWVSNQRDRKERLSQERIELLESVGFEWEARPYRGSRSTEEQWRTVYIDLIHYLTEHGDCNVPKRDGSLGSWVHYQRHRYKAERLAQYRIDYLESIGFAWEVRRQGRYILPESSKPNLKAVARLIQEEEGTFIAKALRAYLDKLSSNQAD